MCAKAIRLVIIMGFSFALTSSLTGAPLCTDFAKLATIFSEHEVGNLALRDTQTALVGALKNNGFSFHEIANAFNERGIATPQKGSWFPSAISRRHQEFLKQESLGGVRVVQYPWRRTATPMDEAALQKAVEGLTGKERELALLHAIAALRWQGVSQELSAALLTKAAVGKFRRDGGVHWHQTEVRSALLRAKKLAQVAFPTKQALSEAELSQTVRALDKACFEPEEIAAWLNEGEHLTPAGTPWTATSVANALDVTARMPMARSLGRELNAEAERKSARGEDFYFSSRKLTRYEERLLFEARDSARAKGDSAEEKRFRDLIVRANLPLVRFRLQSYVSRWVTEEKLMDAAQDALLRSVDQFEWERGFRFSTFAIHKILGAFSAVKRYSERAIRRGKEISPAEDSDVLEAHEDHRELEPSLAASANALSEQVRRKIAFLSKQGQEVVKYRFGLFDYPQLTQREVAEILHVSYQRVQQIEREVLNELKSGFVSEEP